MRLGDTPAASATPLTATAVYPCRANWRRACSRIRCRVVAASREVMCTSIHIVCIVVHMMDELRERLRRTRRVPTPWTADETRGITGARLGELLTPSAGGADWDPPARRIHALPWVTTSAGLRAIHQRSADPGAPVVVLLHGW